jgi:hypothetical protein
MGKTLLPFDRLRRRRHDVEYPPAGAPELTPEDVTDDVSKVAALLQLAQGVLDEMSPF